MHFVKRSSRALCLVALLGTACGSADGAKSSAPVQSEIGPEGGVIQGDGVTLTIPAGALTEATAITVSGRAITGLPNEADLRNGVFQFSPSGLQFAAPATLTLSFAAGVTPDTQSSIGRLNDAEDAWETLEGVVFDGTQASVSIDHFSTYGLITPLFVVGQNAALDVLFSNCGGAKPASAGGFYADSCRGDTIFGSMDKVHLRGQSGTLFENNNCYVSYGDGALSIEFDVPSTSGGNTEYSVKMNGDRDDSVESIGDVDGSPVTHLHLADTFGGVDTVSVTGDLWIDSARNLTFAQIIGPDGSIYCGYDARQ